MSAVFPDRDLSRKITMSSRIIWSALVATGLSTHLGHAQGPVPLGSPIPRILPSAPPAVSPGANIPPPQAPETVPTGTAAIRRVTIEGATAYTAEQLDSTIGELIGPDTALAKIEAARLAILNRYREGGFILTAVFASIDPQGTLTFLVTEGRIADVKLDGDIGPAGTTVLRFLNHLTEQRPIDLATLERWLLLAQEVPGITLRAVLRPSTDEPGALTLIAEVKRAAFSGLAVADNAAYPLAGPAEGLLVFDANSFTEFGDKTEATIYHTSGNTSNFGQVSTELFVGGTGLRVQIYGGYGPTHPSSPLRDIGYEGTTTVFGISARYPVIRRRQQTLDLTASLDAIESDVNIGNGAQSVSKDTLRVLRVGATYALHDTLLGADRGATNSVKVRLSQGLPAFGASVSVGNTTPAASAVTGFTKINAEMSRTQTLFEPWNGADVSLLALVAGKAIRCCPKSNNSSSAGSS
jgi:hemolysin activation/secretion protein